MSLGAMFSISAYANSTVMHQHILLGVQVFAFIESSNKHMIAKGF